MLAAHQLMHRAPQTAQAPAHTALSTQPQDFSQVVAGPDDLCGLLQPQ